jgi:hypothetical protein
MKFGWILTGNRAGVTANQIMANQINMEHCDHDLRSFGTYRNYRKYDQPRKTTDNRRLTNTTRIPRLVSNRRWPQSRAPPEEEHLRVVSESHQCGNKVPNPPKATTANDALRAIYEEQMLDNVVKQHVELAPTMEESTGVFYLPHPLVKKERCGKIKWRIVFDASSSEGNNPSLKNVLEMGPTLLSEVLTTLLRFREHSVSIIGDIQEAFLQLSLDRKDGDLTSFLWYRIFQDDKGDCYATNEVVTYRSTCLPFGLTCSPFLLSATVREFTAMCIQDSPPDRYQYVDGRLRSRDSGRKRSN